ncbi:MAG: DUF952 domain-containing protein [Pseudomonadota bacterium]
MLIYKIFRNSEWFAFLETGSTQGAPIDLADGFIHFSTAATVEETANKHFKDEIDLIVATVSANDVADDLKWEKSRGGLLFPHLYRPLRRSDVLRYGALPVTDRGFDFSDVL